MNVPLPTALRAPATAGGAFLDLPAMSEAARVRLASRATTSPADLLALAHDPAPTIRAAVALNPTAAHAAERHLVRDTDDRIRSLLAGKMARLLPGLTRDESSAAGAHIHAILLTLAQDAAVRVRVALSEALTNLDAAPREVVLRLAQDPETTVSTPILRYSPLLTDTDLLELLATPPHCVAAVTIASRPDLPAVVAQAIADHADSAAVAALLANHTASIQEATLDALVGRAGEFPEWHEPLVCRPSLPPRLFRKLASLVANHLLGKLAQRVDLPPGLAEELRERLDDHLASHTAPTGNEIYERIQRLYEQGQLNEQSFLDAAESGNFLEASAILAVASRVNLATLDRAIALRSAKAIVSLAGRATFSMQAAVAAQNLLGQMAPEEILQPGPDNAFPLTQSEMDWQVELLSEPIRP